MCEKTPSKIPKNKKYEKKKKNSTQKFNFP